MRSIDQLWSTRTGPQACAARTRRVRYGWITLLIAAVSVIGACVFEVFNFDTGAGLCVLVGVVGVATIGVLAGRSVAADERATTAYLGLPRDSCRYLPVLSVDTFVTWISRRNTPRLLRSR